MPGIIPPPEWPPVPPEVAVDVPTESEGIPPGESYPISPETVVSSSPRKESPPHCP